MPCAPTFPAILMVHAEKVPEPPVTSEVIVIVVPETVTMPSMKFAGVVVFAARTRAPVTNALVEALRVNTFEPVPMAKDVVEVTAE